MKAPKKALNNLKSSFVVSGKLKVEPNELYIHLQAAPFLHLASGCGSKTFSIIESNGSTTSELQVIGSKLIFSYRFDKVSTKEYTKNLLKFLSILAYMGDIYETELSSLYPSIMEVLVGCIEEMPYSEIKTENSNMLIKQAKILSSMNCSLSVQILEMQTKCQNLEFQNGCMAKFSRDVIEATMAKIGVRDPNTEHLSKIIGTSAEVYKTVKSYVFEKRVAN